MSTFPGGYKLQDLKKTKPWCVGIFGSFTSNPCPSRKFEKNPNAYYQQSITAGDKLLIYHAAGGPVGNAKHYVATADGGAQASLALTAIDASMGSAVAHTAGTGGNVWKIQIIPGSPTAAGCIATEDNTDKIVTIMYENGVSTSADIMTAIDGTTAMDKSGNGDSTVISNKYLPPTNLAGGTADTYAVESAGTVTLHFKNATTTCTAAVAAINALSSGTQWCSAKVFGTGSHTLVTADAVLSQSLAGGDLAGLGDINTKGYSVTKQSTGVFRVTFDQQFTQLESLSQGLKIDTSANLEVVCTRFGDDYVDLTVYNAATGTATDITDDNVNRIEFMAVGGLMRAAI